MTDSDSADWQEHAILLVQRIDALIRGGLGDSHETELELYAYLREHSTKRDAASCAFEVGQRHVAAADYAGAIVAFRDAREGFLEIGDVEGLSTSDLGVALEYASLKQFDQAIAALHDSADVLLRLGAPTKAARAHLSAACFLMVGERFQDAEPELDTTDRLLSNEKAGDPGGPLEVDGEIDGEIDDEIDDERSTLLFISAITRARLAIVTSHARDAAALLIRAQVAAGEDPLFAAFVHDLQARLGELIGDRVIYANELARAADLFVAQGAPELAAVEQARLALAIERDGGDPELVTQLLLMCAQLTRPGPGPHPDGAARITPYLTVADIEFAPGTLARISRLRH